MSIQGRWSEAELQLIKDVFSNETFVLSVRDVLMGFTDTFDHKTTDTVLGIIRKNLLPTFEPGLPLQMQQDLCLISLDFITGFNSEEAIKRIEAFDLATDYLERRLKVLEGGTDEGQSLVSLKEKGDNRFVRMLAYLQLGNYIEKSLNQFVAMAHYTEPTPKELAEKEKQDSTQ